MPNHELVVHPNGTTSMRDLSTGESMHSFIGPWEEANLLYTQQSRLAERLKSESATPLVLYDVGLGTGANSLAALQTYLSLDDFPKRPLQMISFENDLGGLELALENIESFPFLAPHEGTLRHLAKHRQWSSGNGDVTWLLREGNFLDEIDETPPPELVYYDFYAPDSCPQLWSVQCFEKLFRKTKALKPQGIPTTLYTYAAATPVRVALLLAGFYVGHGTPTSCKSATTVASTRLEELERPLGHDWLEKLRRSSRPFPYGWPERSSTSSDILARTRTTRQFATG
jgi:queuine tRNA-ribosyltransferase